MKLRFVGRARDDLLQARDWYDASREGLSRDFVQEVNLCLELVRRRPLGFPAVYEEVRRVLVKRFPYAIFFRVDGDTVIVLAILHARRAPIRFH